MKLRRRAVLKWTGAGLCALIFVVWFLSRWYAVVRTWPTDGGESSLAIGWGALGYCFRPTGSPGTFFYCLALSDPIQEFDWRYHLQEHGPGSGGWESFYRVPLWAPSVTLLLPTLWLFYRDRRRVRWASEGRCVACGYSLSGLPPGGACPECGKAG